MLKNRKRIQNSMNAYIVLQCATGLGDMYGEVYSSFIAGKELEELGYNVYYNWEFGRNIYYSSNLPLYHLFDQSFSKNEILYRKEEEIKKSNKFISQLYNRSFRIYLSEITNLSKNYQSRNYNHQDIFQRPELFPLDKPPIGIQFLAKPILEIGNKIIQDKKDIIGVNLRFKDFLNDQNYEIAIQEPQCKQHIEEARKFILNNKDKNIFVGSNCASFSKKFSNEFNNTFTNEFLNSELTNHYSYVDNSNVSEDDYIYHAQALAADMYVFSRCKQIKFAGDVRTAFLSYAIFHNLHHQTWKEKLENLLV